MATSILQKIVAHKRTEIEATRQRQPLSELESIVADVRPPRDFLAAVQRPGISLIAEVKKASPSQGIIREDFDPVAIAKTYEEAGANCISVLTDEHFFQGSIKFLQDIAGAVSIPVLRKDFILDEFQVYEARAHGADAVLLIAECLSPDELKRLHDLIVELGMQPLVELYDQANIDSVLACNPSLVGVNNRDLNTFEIDLQHTLNIKKLIPQSITLVGESGIFTRQDALLLEQGGVDAMLVGESLMRAKDIGLAVKTLLGR